MQKNTSKPRRFYLAPLHPTPLVTLMLAALLAVTQLSCSRLFPKKRTVWIYTSLYNNVIENLEPMVADYIKKSDLPELRGVEVKWYQGGSEMISAKLATELIAGKTKADLLITSDPFIYEELKDTHQLLTYESPAAAEVPKNQHDLQGFYVNSRLPVMVMGYHPDLITPNELPKKWSDLAHPKFKNRIAMPNPLESGTAFTSVALLADRYGWDFFKSLRTNNIVAAGGSSSVLTRLQTREKAVGILLLENIVKAQAKGSPVRAIYPEDGSIPILSPIAILKSSEEPEAAKKIYDWFFSTPVQVEIIKSGLYSPLPKIVSPDFARPWKELAPFLFPGAMEKLHSFLPKRGEIKTQFTEIILR